MVHRDGQMTITEPRKSPRFLVVYGSYTHAAKSEYSDIDILASDLSALEHLPEDIRALVDGGCPTDYTKATAARSGHGWEIRVPVWGDEDPSAPQLLWSDGDVAVVRQVHRTGPAFIRRWAATNAMPATEDYSIRLDWRSDEDSEAPSNYDGSGFAAYRSALARLSSTQLAAAPECIQEIARVVAYDPAYLIPMKSDRNTSQAAAGMVQYHWDGKWHTAYGAEGFSSIMERCTMKPKNLTPHSIVVYRDGEVIESIPASGVVARIPSTEKRTDNALLIAHLPGRVVERSYAVATGPHRKGIYIVSLPMLMMLSAAPGVYLVAPDTGARAVRDANGMILGVTGFIAAPSGDRSEVPIKPPTEEHHDSVLNVGDYARPASGTGIELKRKG